MMIMMRRRRTIGRFDDDDDVETGAKCPSRLCGILSLPTGILQQGVFPEFAKFKAGIVNNVKKLSKYHLLGITRKHVLSFFHKKGK